MYKHIAFNMQWIQAGILAAVVATSACAADVPKTQTDESAKPAVKAQGVGDALSAEFDKMSDITRPWVYLFLTEKNLTLEDYTRNLEGLKAKGFGGFIVFHGSSPSSFAAKPAFKHLVNEAERLGLVMGAYNCQVWPAGGPWMEVENRSWMTLSRTLDIEGGQRFTGKLPELVGVGKRTDEMVVQAFPLPAEAHNSAPVITLSDDTNSVQAITDGNYNTGWQPTQATDPKAQSQQNWILVDFRKSHHVDFLWLEKNGGFASVERSDDAVKFTPVTKLEMPYYGPLPATQTRYIRISMPRSTPSRDLVRSFAVGTQAEVRRQAQLGAKTGLNFVPLPNLSQRLELIHSPLSALPEDVILPAERMVDLTGKVAADGTLDWEAPPGRWRIVRLARTNVDKAAFIEPPDYLSATATRQDFAEMAKMGQAAGEKVGKVFRYYYEDNTEFHLLYNWTPKMLDEFKSRRGYDATPYLATLAGQLVGSVELSDRFLNDVRRTIADCVRDNHFGEWTKLANEQGAQTRCEAGGLYLPREHSHDGLANLARVDRMVGEFWTHGIWHEVAPVVPGTSGSPHVNLPDSAMDLAQNLCTKQVASASRLYGKPIVDMESFTSIKDFWNTMPCDLLRHANIAFCEGVNHMTLHASDAVAAAEGAPGQVYVGTHFNAKNTWWPYLDPFVHYIHRCSTILQRGQFVGDVLYYLGDEIPALVPPKHIRESLGFGYDYDECNSEALIKHLTVKDGKLVSRSGTSYRILVLPDRPFLTLQVARRIKEFVAAGVIVIGPKPLRTPGLSGYPQCDAELQAIADELWGKEAKSNKSKILSPHKVLNGVSEKEVLAAIKVPVDFAFTGMEADTLLDFIHRQDGDADIYFVINRRNRTERVECSFRVSGKQPELWNAFDGTRRDLPQFDYKDGRTTVPLELSAYGSCFVVFRCSTTSAGSQARPSKREETDLGTWRAEPACPEHAEGATPGNFPELKSIMDIPGPWSVQFDPRWGGPTNTVTFETLTDWTSNTVEGVKYYSGAATYRTHFQLAVQPEKGLVLDLGTVHALATVRLNGKDLGVLWCAPWRVNITDAVKAGRNKLEIDVVNTWLNRMVGDLALPADKRVTAMPKRFPPSPKSALLSSGLLGPVRIMAAE